MVMVVMVRRPAHHDFAVAGTVTGLVVGRFFRVQEAVFRGVSVVRCQVVSCIVRRVDLVRVVLRV
jgi:hypothetical protein